MSEEQVQVDDLTLVYQPDGQLFTGRVLYGDATSGERGAVAISTFEKVSFAIMFARLAEQVSVFAEKDEKIGVVVRRSDLPNQVAFRFDEETVIMLHVDPVSVIRSMSPAPMKVFLRRTDPAATSPLRVGYDAVAATFGDEVYIRRRGDQVECLYCGRWANTETQMDTWARCRSAACRGFYPVRFRSDRWASLSVQWLLTAGWNGEAVAQKFFLPREWNKPGPWVTCEDLEKKHRDWTQIKKEFT